MQDLTTYPKSLVAICSSPPYPGHHSLTSSLSSSPRKSCARSLEGPIHIANMSNLPSSSRSFKNIGRLWWILSISNTRHFQKRGFHLHLRLSPRLLQKRRCEVLYIIRCRRSGCSLHGTRGLLQIVVTYFGFVNHSSKYNHEVSSYCPKSTVPKLVDELELDALEI